MSENQYSEELTDFLKDADSHGMLLEFAERLCIAVALSVGTLETLRANNAIERDWKDFVDGFVEETIKKDDNISGAILLASRALADLTTPQREEEEGLKLYSPYDPSQEPS